jgi:hypothetical protein
MKARAMKFIKLFHQMIDEVGGVRLIPNNTEYLFYQYALETNEGLLYIKADENLDKPKIVAIYSRFEKPHGKLGSNPYSGKWNHHYWNNPQFEPKEAIDEVRFLLETELNANKPTDIPVRK